MGRGLAHLEKLKKQSQLLQRARAGREELVRDLELAKLAVAKQKMPFMRRLNDCANTQRCTLNRDTPIPRLTLIKASTR